MEEKREKLLLELLEELKQEMFAGDCTRESSSVVGCADFIIDYLDEYERNHYEK
jgi:hypothetical protein